MVKHGLKRMFFRSEKMGMTLEQGNGYIEEMRTGEQPKEATGVAEEKKAPCTKRPKGLNGESPEHGMASDTFSRKSPRQGDIEQHLAMEWETERSKERASTRMKNGWRGKRNQANGIFKKDVSRQRDASNALPFHPSKSKRVDR